jgi:adenosylmethionine-8-amino-7-oxononanoate aminotransferase
MSAVGSQPKSPDAVFHRDLNHRYPIVTHGKGSYLFTENGKKYLDASSGAVAANLGHGVSEIADAMREQALRVGFAHTLRFETHALHDAASQIIELAPAYFGKVYFASGGSEANESAFKLAHQWHVSRGEPERHLVIGLWDNYHGNTLGSLSVGGDAGRRRHYAAGLPRSLRLPSWRDTDAASLVRELVALIRREGARNISALILEPFVGSQLGAYEPPPEALRQIEAICKQHNVVVIADEVMTGFGRCGTHFAIERSGMSPDLITFGKGVTGGYAPLSGVIVSTEVVAGIRKDGGVFHHGFTYSGHPVSVAAAAAALKIYVERDVLSNVAEQGSFLKKELDSLATEFPRLIAEVRGAGMMFALEFHLTALPSGGAGKVNEIAMEHGLVLYPGSAITHGGESGSSFLRPHVLVAPPLTITKHEVEDLVVRLRQVLSSLNLLDP